VAAGAATPPAPAADAGSSSGGSSFEPHVRVKLLQLLHAAPTAAPDARPETATAALGAGDRAAAEVPCSKLRAEAPPFVPRAALPAAPKRSSGLRADAPPFVPRASALV